MTDTSEVVVIGGGAAGCAATYYLARGGAGVTVIEREGVGTQASGYSAGGLNPLQGTGIPGPLGGLAMASFRLHLGLWDELKEGTGIDYQGRIISLVKVAFGEPDLPELQETLDVFNEADGFEAHWLGPAAVAELEPRITSDVIAGVYARGNAALDSYKYTLALADAGKKLGASFRPGRVCGVEKANGRVTGVLLEDGKLACDHLVLAMGPWSRRAEAWLDSYIPVDPLKGELLRTRLPGVTLAHDLSGGGGSLHPKPDGRIWCGTTEEWRGYDKQPSDSARDAILQGAIKLVPEMAQAQVVEHTACLRPVTPDWLPILGRAPGWENVYLATGAGKKGILLSPGMGKAVADLVTRRVSDLPVEGFSPSRFAGPPD